jgi:hypothetical protein
MSMYIELCVFSFILTLCFIYLIEYHVLQKSCVRIGFLLSSRVH